MLLRGCGAASVLGSMLFVAWGYIDKPNISANLRMVTYVLASTVPTLFLVGMVGIVVLCGGQFGVLGWTGTALACYGSGLAAIANVVRVAPLLYGYFLEQGWPPSLIEWLAVMDTGLILVGLAILRTRRLRVLGAIAFVIGATGWAYDLTDSAGVALQVAPRFVHVGFGLLFSLGWVVLGLVLWRRP